MGNWASHKGKWHPKKERIALKNISDKPFEYKGETINPGDDFIYEGPDRQALKELASAGEEFFGQDFRESSEFQDFINSKYKGNTELYLKRIGYKEEEDDEKFEKIIAKVNKHELPKQVEAIKVMGGGKDTAGGGLDKPGGFGDLPRI